MPPALQARKAQHFPGKEAAVLDLEERFSLRPQAVPWLTILTESLLSASQKTGVKPPDLHTTYWKENKSPHILNIRATNAS